MMNIRKIFFIICCTIFLSSCTNGFEEINTDPNRIQKISPGSLVNEVIYEMSKNNYTNSRNINARLMQVQIPYPEFFGGIQRYDIRTTTGVSTWSYSYKWAKDVEEMLKVAKEEEANNYMAVALTLRAWIYSNLTDNFGAIPFSEASRAEEEITQAKYDNAEDIYNVLLADLEEANSLYDEELGMPYGSDILYHSDVKSWQKFTNSLRLRLLLRASNVSPNALTEMKEIIERPEITPIINDFASQAVLDVTGENPLITPYPRMLDLTSTMKAASFYLDLLNDFNDPRRQKLFSVARKGTDTIGYKGIPAAYDEDDIFDYSASNLNPEQVVEPMIIPILTLAEVEFIKAELAQKGILSGAEEFYKNGVSAAIELWTEEPVPDDYFQNPYAKYDGTLDKIMEQKYLSLYFNDFQQWYEYRRTGLPDLPSTSSMLNDGKMPSRLMYPSDQSIYNPSNLNDAIDRMGGEDDINYKTFWERN